jgi:hypothetical protein
MTKRPHVGTVLRFGLHVGVLGLLFLETSAQTAPGPLSVFWTGFEPPEYEAGFRLAGQDGWVANAEGGNQVWADYFPDTGQHGLIGFSKPEGTNISVSVWRPLDFDGIALGNPVVTFTVVMSIADSTEPALRDSFRWSIYNTNSMRLFSLDFDNLTTNIAYLLDDEEGFFVPTPFNFERDGLYDLTITMDFSANHWSARLRGEVELEVVTRQPITTVGAGLHLGDIDAVWVLGVESSDFGDNFMVFDDYRVVAAPAPAPRLELVERRADGTVVIQIDGQDGQQVSLYASDDLVIWDLLATNTVPASGHFTHEDDAAAGVAVRFYRGRLAQ